MACKFVMIDVERSDGRGRMKVLINVDRIQAIECPDPSNCHIIFNDDHHYRVLLPIEDVLRVIEGEAKKSEALMPHVRRHLPFNYQAMVDGKPMVTRDGLKATFIEEEMNSYGIYSDVFFVKIDTIGLREYLKAFNGEYITERNGLNKYVKELELFMVEE